jgi:hypothetical protein
MPWQNFSQMTDADLKAIFAYLRSIPPIANHVPPPLEPPAVLLTSNENTASGPAAGGQ